MAQQVPKHGISLWNDVASLFSHFGAFGKKGAYHEVVRDEEAYAAACRWPMLAELQALAASGSSQAE
jgi:hypothetical protein